MDYASVRYTAQGGMFEGLVRGLKPDETLLAEFAALGFDVSKRKVAYPKEVWTDCLDAVWKQRYPALERYQAWTEICRSFIQGYFDTTLGKLIAVTFPFLSPRMFLNRTPTYIRTGLKETKTLVEWPTPDQAVLTLHGPHEGSGALMVGVLDVSLRRLKVVPTLAPEIIGPVSSRVRISWTAAPK